MAREKMGAAFFCAACGYESPKWMGFCPACRDTIPLVGRPPSTRREPRSWVGEAPPTPQELSTVLRDHQDRIPLAFSELNRVLGGGVVPGSVVLMAGEPGIGKSTLLLQTAQGLARDGGKVLYISGEESVSQIKSRSDRLGSSGRGVYMLAETNADEIVRHLDEFRPALAMVDSVQTIHCDDLPSGPGSVAQVRESTLRIMRWAKVSAVPVVMAGHVTKDGSLAGPRVLEHMVDAVLHLEGDEASDYRILRGAKNRFGSTDEVGIFQMGGGGLEEVLDPSRVLLAQRREGAIGSTIVPVLEGTRPLLVEVQALTTPSVLPVPRRVANGLDSNRLLMLAAVLSRRVGLGLANLDILVNVVGGLRLRDPSSDLAVALAIASSVHNIPVRPHTVVLGEVGLSGELRSVAQWQRRLNEASRLGFRHCVLPESTKRDGQPVPGIEQQTFPTLGGALSWALPRTREASAQSFRGVDEEVA